MFWLLGTGKKLPGRKIALTLTTATAMALACAHIAWARPRGHEDADALRLRLLGSYGTVSYNAFSEASNAITQFSTFPQPMGRAEGERWFVHDLSPWPLLGLYAELENQGVKLFGRPLTYESGFASVTWRVTGARRRSWGTSELVLMAGGSVEQLPEVRAQSGTRSFDLRNPLLTGARFDAKWRAPLPHKRWRIDSGLHWVMPLSLYRVSTVDLNRSSTRGWGFELYLEKQLSERVDAGFGFNYEAHRLEYRPAEGELPQQVDWNSFGPAIYIQFWF